MIPAYVKKYPKMFEPLTIRRGRNEFVFNNRVMMAPVGICATGGGADNGRINAFGVDYWTGIIRGGFSSVTLPMEVPDNGSHEGVFNMNPAKCNYMNLHLLQRSVHAYNGKTFAELIHGGRCMIRPDIPLIGASDSEYQGRHVKGMDAGDMDDVIGMCVEFAHQARRSGFDGVMMHFAHGWLFHDFLSPLSNHRNDEFGGSVENRCRFPLMALKAVREVLGDDLLIELRLNGNDEMEGGITPEDAARQVLIFQDYADMIHITCSTRLDVTSRPRMTPTSFFPTEHNAYASEIVKNTPGVRIPIGSVGAIGDPGRTEQLLEQGKADYVLIARAAIADNDWVQKVKEGREEDIRPCLRCNMCLDHGRRKSKIQGKELVMATEVSFDRMCAVNPLSMQGAVKKRFPAPERRKKVVVVGGGDIGCELSIHLSERGHDCTVVELTHFQAGNAELCIRMSILQFMEKEHVTTLLDTQATEITDSGVHIENGEGKSFLPADTVIIATGTTPLIEERDSFKNVSFDVINIGDCKKASNMQHAIETGFDAGLIL